MSEKKARKRYYRAKKIRFTIALIIIFLLVLTSSARYLMLRADPGVSFLLVPFVLFVLIFLFLVVVLTLYFSYRLKGPFKRLESEIDNMISSGNYQGTLNLRDNDDKHLKSFISKINKIIDESQKPLPKEKL